MERQINPPDADLEPGAGEDSREDGSPEIVDYLVSFAPWAGYVAFTALLGSWKYGFAVGLGLAAAIVAWRTFRRDSRFLDIGTLAYCAVMTVVSTVDPTSPLRPYNLPMSMAAVGGLSTASLAIGSPFTYRIARAHVSQALLEHPGFERVLYRAHVMATSSWAVSQAVAGGASAMCVAAHLTPAAIAVQSAGTLVPVAVTRYHHERALAPLAPTGGETAGEAAGVDRPPI